MRTNWKKLGYGFLTTVNPLEKGEPRMAEQEATGTLKKVQDFFNSLSTAEQQEAWALLAGIRGPDNEDEQAKYWWTNKVRFAISPKTFSRGANRSSPFYQHIPTLREEESGEEYIEKVVGKMILDNHNNKKLLMHFATHIAGAFYTIQKGLTGSKDVVVKATE